jgi:hypothetical protein
VVKPGLCRLEPVPLLQLLARRIVKCPHPFVRHRRCNPCHQGSRQQKCRSAAPRHCTHTKLLPCKG